MPVITVAVLPHSAERGLLRAVADAVAAALGLGSGDVIAMTIPVRASATSGTPTDHTDDPWMLVSIHGSDRGEEPMREAREAARLAAADWSRTNGGEQGVWCEWVLPQ
ncbi:hypothetical protein MRBLWO14_001461 [Microbacterium sp. LWO14-1.2]|uniref:hypothetical protein n=1 Tax=Microbacterium sp. LWO14-1.2 TaxID=3135263 RepID=UPI00313A248A